MGKKARLRKDKRVSEEKVIKEHIEAKVRSLNPFYLIWTKWQFWAYVVVIVLIILFPFYNKVTKERAMNKDNVAVFHTTMGDITVELYKTDAPNTVNNFVKLSSQGFYDGLLFHRVIKSFMIQGGDPKGDGTGGPGYQFDDEPTDHKIVAGTLAMANSGPNTNGSQFFIVTEQAQTHLDGKYNVFGKVLSGLDIAVKISEVAVDGNDKPIEDVKINSIEIQSRKLAATEEATSDSTSVNTVGSDASSTTDGTTLPLSNTTGE